MAGQTRRPQSNTELLDRHAIVSTEAKFQLPPTLKDVRGNKPEVYSFAQIVPKKETRSKEENTEMMEPLLVHDTPGKKSLPESSAPSSDTRKKRRVYHKAIQHPTIDKVIKCLQDKRIADDEPNQLQDLQLPLLRKVLNVIFISLGVAFLLGVIVVIIYTSIAMYMIEKHDKSKEVFNNNHEN